MASFREAFAGSQGFEELRKYIKHGNEFCKELSQIMQERFELETRYASSLSKLGSKLTKAAGSCLGTLADGWKAVAQAMEQEAETHRTLSTALRDDLQKPMKALHDTQHKTRRPIESTVEKDLKKLSDKRSEEAKSKRQVFAYSKETEKAEDTVRDAKAGKGKVTEKDTVKIEKKCKQCHMTLRKADKEYIESTERLESSRQEWELSVNKGCSQLQTLEEERLSCLRELLKKYHSHLSEIGPRSSQVCDQLYETCVAVNVQTDIRTIVQQKGGNNHQAEQILIDCYAEEPSYSANKERRRGALQTYLVYIVQSVEREKKGREGVEKLVTIYRDKPNFGDPEAQEDARLRLIQVAAMLNFLEASHYKISSAMMLIDGRPKPTHKSSAYIEQTKDKQGIPCSTLRLPMNLAMESNMQYDMGGTNGVPQHHPSAPQYPTAVQHPSAPQYPTAVQHPSAPAPAYTAGPQDPVGEGEYHVQGSCTPNMPQYPVDSDFDDDDDGEPFHIISRCRAIYDYQGTHADEIHIRTGDIISVYKKQADGWWHGELNGARGIFPASYVQDI